MVSLLWRNRQSFFQLGICFITSSSSAFIVCMFMKCIIHDLGWSSCRNVQLLLLILFVLYLWFLIRSSLEIRWYFTDLSTHLSFFCNYYNNSNNISCLESLCFGMFPPCSAFQSPCPNLLWVASPTLLQWCIVLDIKLISCMHHQRKVVCSSLDQI